MENDAHVWAEHADLVAFYATSRCRPEDLYPSERRFLPWLARQAESVLDTGCAAGGFSGIWRHYNPAIQYTGIDVSHALIEKAGLLHPDLRFLVGNVTAGLPLPNRCATVVDALGWLHWEPDYLQAMRELWRLTGRHLFFDVRLAECADRAAVGRQKMALASEWDGKTTTPYITVGWDQFAAFLVKLRPSRILGYGYRGLPAETVMGIESEVCFASFVLEKSAPFSDVSAPDVCVDMPLGWPGDLVGKVNLLPGPRLDEIVPRADA